MVPASHLNPRGLCFLRPLLGLIVCVHGSQQGVAWPWPSWLLFFMGPRSSLGNVLHFLDDPGWRLLLPVQPQAKHGRPSGPARVTFSLASCALLRCPVQPSSFFPLSGFVKWRVVWGHLLPPCLAWPSAGCMTVGLFPLPAARACAQLLCTGRPAGALEALSRKALLRLGRTALLPPRIGVIDHGRV